MKWKQEIRKILICRHCKRKFYCKGLIKYPRKKELEECQQYKHLNNYEQCDCNDCWNSNNPTMKAYCQIEFIEE